ncbi:MAG: hypothetical protein SPL43_01910 [Prevotella sp.]|nr:hypothetical protein [Prevotella sp.]
MEIIEKYLEGKHSQETCEDGIVITNHYVAVIDGSTSKTRHRINPEMSNGRYAMVLLSAMVPNLRGDEDMREFCLAASQTIHNAYVKASADTDYLGSHPAERLTASMVVYSATRHEVWLVGDCQCLVNGIYHDNPKPYEAELAAKRAAVARELRLTPQMPDAAREAILPQMLLAMQGQNRDYAVIDGFETPVDKVKVIGVQPGSEVVLASDGYPFLEPTWAESERRLAYLLEHDPMCVTLYKATKGLKPGNHSFDDRAYVRISTVHDRL